VPATATFTLLLVLGGLLLVHHILGPLTFATRLLRLFAPPPATAHYGHAHTPTHRLRRRASGRRPPAARAWARGFFLPLTPTCLRATLAHLPFSCRSPPVLLPLPLPCFLYTRHIPTHAHTIYTLSYYNIDGGSTATSRAFGQQTFNVARTHLTLFTAGDTQHCAAALRTLTRPRADGRRKRRKKKICRQDILAAGQADDGARKTAARRRLPKRALP